MTTVNPYESPSSEQRVAAPPRRTGLATVFFVVGTLGMIAGLFNLALVLGDQTPTVGSMTQSSLLVDAALALLAKVGLLASGAVLWLKHRRSVPVLVGSLLVSVLDSFYKVAVVTPNFASANQAATYFGVLLIAAGSAGLYLFAIMRVKRDEQDGAFPHSVRSRR